MSSVFSLNPSTVYPAWPIDVPQDSSEEEELTWADLEVEIDCLPVALLVEMRPRHLISYLAGTIGVPRAALMMYKAQAVQYVADIIEEAALAKKKKKAKRTRSESITHHLGGLHRALEASNLINHKKRSSEQE